MQQKDDERDKKEPVDMTTDEALEYCFGSEITEELKRQAGQIEEPEYQEPDSE